MRQIILFLIPLIVYSTGYAENIVPNGLHDVSNFVNDVCTTVPINGQTRTVQFDANAQEKTESFLKKLADLQINGAATVIQTNYSGVLQQDLAGSIKNANDCKSELSKILINKFFPEITLRQKENLVNAKSLCDQGDLIRATSLYDAVLAETPYSEQAIEEKQACVAENGPRDIDVTFMLEPGAYVSGGRDAPLIARFMMDLGGRYCGSFNNRHGSITNTCSIESSSLVPMNITYIHAELPSGQVVSDRGSCNGFQKLKPNNNKYFVVMCIKNLIKCGLVPEDSISNFDYDKCAFE